ncbi:MAG: N-acetylmuramoyl-L-alanine amidase, partial [Oscillospiraceae bacterium]|nr:N-acetylmuramoyl-L-alanine amidase [Oscillospiraceae bacterium]
MKRSLKFISVMLAVIFCIGGFPAYAESDLVPAEPESDFVQPLAYSPNFFLPHNMRGIIISPETDFAFTPEDNAAQITRQLDDIYEYVLSIGINSVIINTSVEGRAYYDLDMNRNGRLDVTRLAVDHARNFHLNVYLIYDISHAVNPEDDSAIAINSLISEVHKLTLKYPCNGIILDNYYNFPEVNDFPRYMRNGAGIGYENWLIDSTEYLFETAGAVIRKTDNSVPVGVMINSQWAQSLERGSADTKKYIEEGFVDFIMVRSYNTLADGFEAAAQWWGELCEENNLPLYLIHHNEQIGSGWGEDQLLRQLTIAKENIPAYSGSVFNSFSALEGNAPNSAVTLKRYFDNLIDEESLMRDLVMTSPRNFSFTTFEPTVDFMGTFDRNFDVYFNNQRIVLNEAGNFFFPEPLDIGWNTFTIRHKDSTYTYRIERRIIVMREIDESISEGKSLRVEGGTSINLEAVAYRGATVTATINGQTVRLVEQAGTLDDADVNSAYTSFTGRYTVPEGIIGTEQPLGQISVQASYSGYTSNINGAAVTVNAKPIPPPVISLNPVMFDQSALGDGEIVGTIDAVRSRDEEVRFVRLNNNHTHVFDAKTTGTVFDPRFGQLPAGTLDYFRSESGGFLTTDSGKRFLAGDVSLIGGTGIG